METAGSSKSRYILTILLYVTSMKKVTRRQSSKLTSAVFSAVLFRKWRNIMVRIIWGVTCRSAVGRAAIWRRVWIVQRTRPAIVQSIAPSSVRFFGHLFSLYLLRSVSDEEGEDAVKIQLQQRYKLISSTVMRRLTTGIRSEKYVVRRFRCYTHVIECTYTNPDSIAYYTPTLLLLGYKPVQHVTILNTVGNSNTLLNSTMLYYNNYNIMGSPSYTRSVVDWNVVMRCVIIRILPLHRHNRSPQLPNSVQHSCLDVYRLCGTLSAYRLTSCRYPLFIYSFIPFYFRISYYRYNHQDIEIVT